MENTSIVALPSESVEVSTVETNIIQGLINMKRAAAFFWEEQFARYNLLVGFIIFGLLGVFGNILIIVVLCKKGYHLATNVYRINLAVCDLLFTVLKTALGSKMLSGFGHPVLCRAEIHLLSSLEMASAWTIIAVTIERVIAVYMPLKVKGIVTRKLAVCTVICMDLFFLAINCVNYFSYGPVYMPAGPNGSLIMVAPCAPGIGVLPALAFYQIKVAPMLQFTLSFLIPFGVIGIGNIMIIVNLIKTARKRSRMTSSTANDDQNKMLTITLVAVGFFFLVCVSPLKLMMIIFEDVRVQVKSITVVFVSFTIL